MAAPTIDNTARTITVASTGTSYSELVSTIEANTSAGTKLDGKRLELDYDLVVPAGATYTSEARVIYSFLASARIRLNAGATIDWSADNTIIYTGNAKGHSVIAGTNNYIRLKFIIETASGRNDFSNSGTAWVGTDLTLITAHAGSTFLHLENSIAGGVQQGPTRLAGSTKIINEKPSGNFYIQLDSALGEPKTYVGIDISNAFNNASTTILYAPRLLDSRTICQEFIFSNQALNVQSGDIKTAAASVILRNPTFSGAANNLATITRTHGGGGSYCAEEFSFNPVSLINNANPIALRITNAAGTEVFNNDADDTSLVSFTPNGQSLPVQVIWLETRRSTGGAAATRTTFNIRARRIDLVEINLSNISLTAPLVYNSGANTNPDFQDSFSDYTAVTSINTGQQLYYYRRYWLSNNLDVDDFLEINDDTITSDYSIVVDANASEVFAVSDNTITIKATEFSGNIIITGTGTANAVNGATISGLVRDAVGDSRASIIVPAGITEVTLHDTKQEADDGTNPRFTGTEFRYRAMGSDSLGGQTLFVRAVGEDTEIIDAIHFDATAGSHEYEVRTSNAENARNAIIASTTRIEALLTRDVEAARDAINEHVSTIRDEIIRSQIEPSDD